MTSVWNALSSVQSSRVGVAGDAVVLDVLRLCDDVVDEAGVPIGEVRPYGVEAGVREGGEKVGLVGRAH